MIINRFHYPTVELLLLPQSINPEIRGLTNLLVTPKFIKHSQKKALHPHSAAMAQLNSDLDDEINQFFTQASATRTEYDELALRTFRGRVEPVSVQEPPTSYTIIIGLNREKIVQFPNMDAQLDIRMLDLAR